MRILCHHARPLVNRLLMAAMTASMRPRRAAVADLISERNYKNWSPTNKKHKNDSYVQLRYFLGISTKTSSLHLYPRKSLKHQKTSKAADESSPKRAATEGATQGVTKFGEATDGLARQRRGIVMVYDGFMMGLWWFHMMDLWSCGGMGSWI